MVLSFFQIISNIFTNIVSIMNTTIYIILINDYLKRTFPEKHEEYLIFISLQIIRQYSKCEILLNNVWIDLKKKINKNPRLKKIMNDIILINKNKKIISNEIEYIKYGVIHNTYRKDHLFSLDEFDDDSFFIFSDTTNENEEKNKEEEENVDVEGFEMKHCVNKKIITLQTLTMNNNELIKNEESVLNYKLSSVKFIMLEARIDNNIYKLNLNDKTYNYYIVDNIIDKNFVMYYLINHLKDVNIENILKTTDLRNNFFLKIIDQNINSFELNLERNESITLKKDNYVCNNTNKKKYNKNNIIKTI